MSKIIDRIEKKIGVSGLLSLLAERLTPTDLQSLLLEVYRQRASKRTPAAVLADYETNRFVKPSVVSPVVLNEWEAAAFAALPPAFEAIELSPVAPLGTSSVIGSVEQNWAVSTSRNTEVVSDSTNVLALESALRRRHLLRENPKSNETIHLAANHRLLRGQFFGDNPHFFSHFNVFSLCSAGRDQGNLAFEVSTLGLHIRIYLRALRTFLGELVPLRVALTDFNTHDRRTRLEDELLAPIRAEFANTTCEFYDNRTQGRGYYLDLCFKIYAQDVEGNDIEIGDGGVVDWTQKLLSNAKERLVTSGIAGEGICMRLARTDSG